MKIRNLKENNLRIIDEAKHQLTASDTESDTLQQQIELLKTGDYLHRSVIEIKRERENLLKKYAEAETSFQVISKQLANLQQTHDNISGRLQANKEALAGELKSRDTMNDRIDEQLKHSGFATLVEVKNIPVICPGCGKGKKES